MSKARVVSESCSALTRAIALIGSLPGDLSISWIPEECA